MEKVETDCQILCDNIKQAQQLYQELPQLLTKTKFDLVLNHYDPYQRMTMLAISDISIGLLSRRIMQKGLLRTFRNITVGHIMISAFIAPELHNFGKIFLYKL